MTTHSEIVKNLLKAGRIGWAFDPDKREEVLVERGTGCEIQGDGVPSPRTPQIFHPRETKINATTFRAKSSFFEGFVQYMYLDCKGYVTVGIGHKIDNAEKAKELEFYKRPEEPGGKREKATLEEKEKAFDKVLGSGLICRDPEKEFKNMTKLDLDPGYIEDLFDADVNEFIRQLRDHFEEFDTYPKIAQIGLLDLLYNIGRKKFLGTKKAPAFPLLHKALEYRNWIEVAEQSHREERNKQGEIMPGMVNRNTIVREWFLEAIGDDPFFVNPKCAPKSVSAIVG